MYKKSRSVPGSRVLTAQPNIYFKSSIYSHSVCIISDGLFIIGGPSLFGQDGWILAKFLFLACLRTGPISSHLDRTSLVNKGSLLSGKRTLFSWAQRVISSGQDGAFLPARVANHRVGFGSSCPLTQLLQPYNKYGLLAKREHDVKMAGYWPSSFLGVLEPDQYLAILT